MNFADQLGWIGNIFFIAGAITLANKKRVGFIHQILGNVFYFFQSIVLTISSLGILSLILIGINWYGWLKWKE